VAEAIGYLLCAVLGAILFRYAEPISAAINAVNRRFNGAIEARLPSIRGRRLRHPEAVYGLMYVFLALGGMMFVVIGLIGFLMSF
jgi:hypothetical protein